MKKTLNLLIALIALIFIILSPFLFYNNVTIEKEDYSQYEEDILIGEFYYEKPIIADKFSGAVRINKYFEDSSKDFFNESSGMFSDMAFERMKGYLEDAKKNSLGDLKNSPYCALTQQGSPKFLSLWLLEFREVLINIMSKQPVHTSQVNISVFG